MVRQEEHWRKAQGAWLTEKQSYREENPHLIAKSGDKVAIETKGPSTRTEVLARDDKHGYLPPRTIFAIVASCMFEVPS